MSRSNSARAPKMWKISLPPGVVVSIFSCKLRKPRSRRSSSATVSIRCRSERPSRSNFQTTSVSPGRNWSRTVASAGRSSRGTAGDIDEDAITADRFEGVVLQVGILVSCGHTGVPQQVWHRAARRIVSKTSAVVRSETLITDASYGRAFKATHAAHGDVSQKRSFLNGGMPGPAGVMPVGSWQRRSGTISFMSVAANWTAMACVLGLRHLYGEFHQLGRLARVICKLEPNACSDLRQLTTRASSMVESRRYILPRVGRLVGWATSDDMDG
jgi:hypothetical protein